MKSKRYIRLRRLAKRNSIHIHSDNKYYYIKCKYKDGEGRMREDKRGLDFFANGATGYRIKNLDSLESELKDVMKRKAYYKSNEYMKVVNELAESDPRTLLSKLFPF